MQIELYKVPLGYCPVSLCLFTLLSRFVNIIPKSLCQKPCSMIALTPGQHVSLFHKEILFCLPVYFEALWVYGWREKQRRAAGAEGGVCLDETQDGDILLCRLSLWVTLGA